MSRPHLLFLSPTIPALTGHGSAMRAGMILEALAQTYDVSLVVLHIYRQRHLQDDRAFVKSLCRRCEVVSPDQIRAAAKNKILNLEGFDPVDCFHVFRLVMAPHIRSYLKMPTADRPLCALDLDDFESKTAGRVADLYKQTGEHEMAEYYRAHVHYLQRMERAFLPRFDNLYVCQAADGRELNHAYACVPVQVIHNGVRISADAVAQSGHPITLIFVGTMDYFPNEDGVRWFCREVLPDIREQASGPFRVLIIGTRPSAAVQALASEPEVTVTGEVAEVDPFYTSESIAVVPIRAGGGTRVKILEAMSHRCAVVSTSMGAEGLEARRGEHLLIADTATGFAAACVSLISNAERRREIGDKGFDWVQIHHSRERIQATVRELSGDRVRRSSVRFEHVDL